MTTRITAAVARTPGGPFTLETLELEDPRAGEVLVRVAGVGLCHTDLVFRDQLSPYPLPAVLGHEGSGVVEAVGEGVTAVEPGDRVVIGFSSCGRCARCAEGLPPYCRDFPPLNFAGARPEDGTAALSEPGGAAVASHFFGQSSFATHALVRERNLVRVDDPDLPLELLGPLGCGFQTGAGAVLRSMDCRPGASLLVMGGGPVGLAAVMAGAIRGCAPIVLVEPLAARRDLALELGASHVVEPGTPLGDLLPGGVDYALDTSGRPDAIETARATLAPRGMLGLVGVPPAADQQFAANLVELITFGHRVVGIIEGDSDQQSFVPELLEHFRAGRFPLDRLVRTFPLSGINEAVAAQARGECVKAVLIPPGAPS